MYIVFSAVVGIVILRHSAFNINMNGCQKAYNLSFLYVT